MATPSKSNTTSPFAQLVSHGALQAAQVTSMVVPPAYLIFTVARGRTFTIRRFLNASTVGVLAGAGVGGGIAYGRLQSVSEERMVAEVAKNSHNKRQVRQDDYSIIGASVGAILSPAILLNRASIPVLVLGGASIGLGAGVWTWLIQSALGGKDAKPPAVEAVESAGKSVQETVASASDQVQGK